MVALGRDGEGAGDRAASRVNGWPAGQMVGGEGKWLTGRGRGAKWLSQRADLVGAVVVSEDRDGQMVGGEGQMVGRARPRRTLTPAERGLALLKVVYGGRHTTVSMDLELWGIVCGLLGGEPQARRWMAEQMPLIEGLEATSVGSGARGAGLSRLLQRRVYDLLARRLGVAKM